MLKSKFIGENILFVTCDHQWEITDTFLRPQEFYKSPLEEIQGRFFTLDDYIIAVGKKFKTFDYHTRLSGFNLPGATIKEFLKVFTDLRKVEKNLIDQLVLNGIDPFNDTEYYVIGTYEVDNARYDGLLSHELSHAYFGLNQQYRNKTLDVLKNIPTEIFNILQEDISKMGYADSSILDEMNAYITTSTTEEFNEGFSISIDVFPCEILHQLINNYQTERERNNEKAEDFYNNHTLSTAG